ncbi:MAG: hypothetical protein AAB738_00020 [Patescibacteria group bacterium]
MIGFEYYKSKQELKTFRKSTVVNPSVPIPMEKFRKLIELEIAVRGHGWSMDVKGERRKMARLLTQIVSKSRRFRIVNS